MSTLSPHRSGREEGECRKDAAHSLLETRRDALIRRARRALLGQLLAAGTATADDVAEQVEPPPDGIDPRFLGTVPGPLARAGIIRAASYTKSARPSRHASLLTVWELADRAAALAWLVRNPNLPDPEPDDDAGHPCSVSTSSPRPAPLAVTTVSQATLF
jgi:hypothetical protein